MQNGVRERGGPAMISASGGTLSNRYLFYGLASVSMLMFAVDSSIVTVALRTLVVDLDTTLAWAGWILTGYALTQTVAMPVVGKLAEQFGEMRVFVICVVVFIVGSLFCGLATNVYMLIACRVLQALGGGGIMPSAVSIIARAFPESRNRMLGLFTSIFPIGGIIGPNVGGLLLEHFSWRVLFLVNVPVGLIVVPLLARQIAAYDGRRAANAGPKRRLDVVGAGLFGGAMVALLMSLTFIAKDPSIVWTPTLWLMVAASIGLFALFGWQEGRVAEPVIDLTLVTRHPFAIVNLHNFLFGACVWGCFAFVPYYAAVQYHMGPLESGAIMTPRSITAIVLGTATSFLMVRLGYRLPIVVGLALISISNIVLGLGLLGNEFAGVVVAPFVLMAITVGVAGIGTGLVMPAANNAVLDLMPERAGVISGMRGMFRSTGGIIGTAVIVVALSLSEDQAAGLRTMFTVYGILLLVAIPLTFAIPEMSRESQRAGDRAKPGQPRAPHAAEAPVSAVPTAAGTIGASVAAKH
jgi:EmrB/QacA subfamily drug resistance transporter